MEDGLINRGRWIGEDRKTSKKDYDLNDLSEAKKKKTFIQWKLSRKRHS